MPLSPYRVLDLTDEKGYLCSKIFADLGADVLIENFTPATMERKWKLGYAGVRDIRPDIIMLSSSPLGQTGPEAQQAGFGLERWQ